MTLAACTCSKKTTEAPHVETAVENVAVQQRMTGGSASVASPRAIVYKTRKDYGNNLPIVMDETKTRIVTYPAPTDVRHIPVPTQLDEGFLLDNRGIGKDVVFTSWTYEEYAALEKTPSQEEILARIIDKDPLVEMWVCAPRLTYSNLVEDLNYLIKAGFTGCDKIK